MLNGSNSAADVEQRQTLNTFGLERIDEHASRLGRTVAAKLPEFGGSRLPIELQLDPLTLAALHGGSLFP